MKKGQQIYLDHASHTPCSAAVIEIVRKISLSEYGNPSATHRFGLRSHDVLENSRRWFAEHFRVSPEFITFTSSGTEANNLAILGTLSRKELSKQHAVTTSIEHSSVYNLYKDLEARGLPVTYLKVDSEGLVSLEELNQVIRPQTAIISTIGVNNEIGTIQRLSELGTSVKRANPSTLLHVDGVQAFGKIHIPLKDNHIDLFTISGHKIHGPLGVGALILTREIPLVPQLIGGEQERGRRAGTENFPAIAGFHLAAKEAALNLDLNFKHVKELWDHCREGVENFGSRIHLNSPHDGSPYLLNFSVKGIPSETALRMFDELGIALSAGSACNHLSRPNRILLALGLPKETASSSLRASFSPSSQKSDVEFFLNALKTILSHS
ncbi:MAG: cysteine desulfurase [Deltaproteobacteria bacterium]|nr:cysteine desulfurase [Deltaproteobacteria bacterium]